MKIYFAGDITEGDWRYSFMDPKHLIITAEHVKKYDDRGGYYKWPVMQRAVFNALDYVGPFTHDGSDDVNGFFSFLAGETKSNVLEGIDHADCVFCLVTPDVIFGRAALDVGYALAKSKPVFFASMQGGWETNSLSSLFIFYAAYDFVWYEGSPMEALHSMLLKYGFLFGSPLEKAFWEEAHTALPSLTPQFPVGKYYADFAIREKKIAVEIDGQDFHSSKEQRTRDASRDRFFIEQGWTVLRFTGTEIFKDVKRCVQQVVSIAERRQKGESCEN